MYPTNAYILPTEKLQNLIYKNNQNLLTKIDDQTTGIKIDDFKKFIQTKEFSESGMYVHELLTSCEILLPAPKQEPRNPVLEARIQKLKAEYANKEYQKMIQNLGPQGGKHDPIQNDVKAVSAQITSVINFVLTVAGSFLFFYKATEYALPEPNIPAQVLIGIFTAVTVAVADLYFLLRNTI